MEALEKFETRPCLTCKRKYSLKNMIQINKLYDYLCIKCFNENKQRREREQEIEKTTTKAQDTHCPTNNYQDTKRARSFVQEK